MLLRNGSCWFCLTVRHHITGNIPGNPISQKLAAHGHKLVHLFFITLKITGKMIRVSLHKFNRYVFYMCLPNIAQINHPSDIEFRNTVMLFKCNAVRYQSCT